MDLNVIIMLLINEVITPQTVYKVPICPRGNLLYIQIYFTNNTSNKVEKKPISLLLNEYLAQH